MKTRPNFLYPVLAVLLLSACGKRANDSVAIDTSTTESPSVEISTIEAPAAEDATTSSCSGKYFNLASFSNANWLEGKEREGTGLMFDALTEEEFAQAKTIYIAEASEVRDIKLRRGAGPRLKYFIMSGEQISDVEFEKVCINFK